LASLASSGKIICKEKIVLGNYARIGSESQLIDTNFHQMIDTKTGEKFKMTAPIELGEYNFISNRVTIMQKTITPNYCTIASNSLVNKDYSGFGENILIGGIPAKLLKENISRDWKGELEDLEKNLIVY
jgi:acetyltransferase-like isoleucine patch superfamily enzyme